MSITKHTLYRFDSTDWNTLDAVAEHIENEIGVVLDKTPNRLTPSDRLALHTTIIANRERLVFLLGSIDVVQEMKDAEEWD